MKQETKRIIITKTNVNNRGTLNLLTYPKNNLNESEAISTKFYNTREIKTININPINKKIALNISKKKENHRNNIKYKMLIKRIANKLKKRIYFPKCKIIKFYLEYRLSILKIANKLKKTAKLINFWDKYLTNITEKEMTQIQEIASTACKIIQAGGQKKINKKKISSSNKKNRKNIKNRKINIISILEKNNEIESNNNNDDNNDNNKYEINKNLSFLKNINENNDEYFIKEFSSFLENNNIKISPESKLPLFMNDNNMSLLSQKEFWIKYIIFISKKYKNDLSMYNYIFFIEQFYIWNYNSNSIDEFNKEIKKQINLLFNEENVNKFLITNKIKDLDGLFEKYKNIHMNNNSIYKEIKVDGEDIKDKICNCPTCVNKGYIDKIIDYNKNNNEISLAKNNNFSFVSNNVIKFDKTKIKKNEEISILSKKDEENENIFKYLKKIEMGKNEEEKKGKEKVKKRNSNYKKKRKNKKKDKIQEIFDLLSIDGDSQISEDSYDSLHKSTKRRTKSTKIKSKGN